MIHQLPLDILNKHLRTLADELTKFKKAFIGTQKELIGTKKKLKFAETLQAENRALLVSIRGLQAENRALQAMVTEAKEALKQANECLYRNEKIFIATIFCGALGLGLCNLLVLLLVLLILIMVLG